ncbi:hypothetical protein SUDANB95_03191 [Actinosynnema sp. ALI-1.44]
MKTVEAEGISVEDVPDVSAAWYLDLAGLGAAAPEPVRVVAAIATEAVIGVFAVLFVLVWWRARGWDAAAMARALVGPVVTVVAYLVSEGVKGVWREDRPCRVLGEVATVVPCPGVGDWSFPSNHATIAGAAAVALAWSGWRVGWGLALVAAASRVFVGVHYPHDVVAGLALGAVVALLVPVVARAVTPVVVRLRAHDAGAVVLGGR